VSPATSFTDAAGKPTASAKIWVMIVFEPWPISTAPE
jgi:hypothetical protein